MIHRIKILFVIFLFLVPAFSFSQDEEKIFQEGNEFFKQKQYEESIKSYTQLVNSGYEGTSLYYNLGNAYYRQGKLGYAILYYEKSLKLSPGDEDIRHNLLLANLKTVDKLESFPQFFLFEWWEGLLALLTVSGWMAVAYIFYIILILTIGLYFFIKNVSQQKIILISALSAFILFILSSVLLIIKFNKDVNIKNGIVIENAVNVKISPDPASNDAFIIHEGIKVRLEDEVDNWIRVKLEDGKVGWIEKNAAKVI